MPSARVLTIVVASNRSVRAIGVSPTNECVVQWDKALGERLCTTRVVARQRPPRGCRCTSATCKFGETRLVVGASSGGIFKGGGQGSLCLLKCSRATLRQIRLDCFLA